MLDRILTVIYLIIGVYFLFSGFTKKGKMYENPNIAKESYGKFERDMSLFMKLAGPLLCVGACAELAKANPLVYAVCYMGALLSALVLIIRVRKYIKRV